MKSTAGRQGHATGGGLHPGELWMHPEPNTSFTGEQTEAREKKSTVEKPRENMRVTETAVPIMVRSTGLE
jgi:hypothetical protein